MNAQRKLIEFTADGTMKLDGLGFLSCLKDKFNPNTPGLMTNTWDHEFGFSSAGVPDDQSHYPLHCIRPEWCLQAHRDLHIPSDMWSHLYDTMTAVKTVTDELHCSSAEEGAYDHCEYLRCETIQFFTETGHSTAHLVIRSLSVSLVDRDGDPVRFFDVPKYDAWDHGIQVKVVDRTRHGVEKVHLYPLSAQRLVTEELSDLNNVYYLSLANIKAKIEMFERKNFYDRSHKITMKKVKENATDREHFEFMSQSFTDTFESAAEMLREENEKGNSDE